MKYSEIEYFKITCYILILTTKIDSEGAVYYNDYN